MCQFRFELVRKGGSLSLSYIYMYVYVFVCAHTQYVCVSMTCGRVCKLIDTGVQIS